jgi:excisionase family DNA binding protein
MGRKSDASNVKRNRQDAKDAKDAKVSIVLNHREHGVYYRVTFHVLLLKGAETMEERRDETGAFEEDNPPKDMDEGPHIGFIESDSSGAGGLTGLESHRRHDPHDPAHVDLLQEEYTPEEAARLIGTSLEVVMRAIWDGDLKAERQGQNVICIEHADLTDWLRRRAAE